MTIKRIIIIAWAILAVTVCILVFALYNVQKNTNAIEAAQQSRKNSLLLAQELHDNSVTLTDSVRQFAATGDKDAYTAYWDCDKVAKGEKERPKSSAIAPGKRVPLLTLMEQAGFTAQELRYLREASDLSNSLIILEEQAMHAAQGEFPDGKGGYTLKGAPDTLLAVKLVFSREYNDHVAKIMAPITFFNNALNERLDGLVDQKQAGYDQAIWILRGACVVLVVLVACFLIMVSTVIVKPIFACIAFAGQVVKGNLESDLQVSSHNEIGSLATSLRAMVASLRERITHAERATRKAEEQSSIAALAVKEAEQAKQVAELAKSQGMRQAGDQLHTIAELAQKTSGELSRHIGRAKDGAKEQQSQLESSSQAMEQLSQSVMHVARNTASTTESADAARHNAQEGLGIVNNVVGAISDVDRKTSSLRESLNQLGKEAEGINRIMNVISDIADQTNLLALNAAIEAARAGEAGRGFAVVADEVRKLAEKTMQATGEVASAVRSIQASTTESIRGIQEASAAVLSSTNMAKSSGDSLQQIVSIAKDTAEKVHSIAVTTEEQSRTCDELTNATESIAQLANETMITMDEASRAVEAINAVVQQVQKLTQELRSA